MTNPLLDPNARLVIAHRGNGAGAPENTLEALQQAVALGADAIEFDVRVTRDGVAVLLHDATLDRTTSGRGRLADVDFAEVRTLDASMGSAPWTGPKPSVPTLEEVLDRFRDTPFVIDIKELAAAEPTERLVRRFGAQGRVVIGSDQSDVMQRLYRSGLRTCASKADALFLLPLAVAGLTPLTPDYSVLSITPRLRGLPIPVLRMAAAARRVGVATYVWTVNDPTTALDLWRGGVAGIVTDDPEAMLRARGR